MPDTILCVEIPKRSLWEDERAILWLIKLWPDHSAKDIAGIMSKEFGVRITRNAVIGKLHRLGLTQENKGDKPVTRGPRALRKPRAPRPARNPIFRIINAGGGAMRVIETLTGGLTAPVCVEVEPLNLTMAQLERHHCRWIANDLYCGHPVQNKPGFQEEKSSYCKWHHVIVWRAPLPRRAA